MNRVHVPAVPAVGEDTVLGPAESHHLLHVTRLPRGARLALVDGAGASGEAVLVDVADGLARVRVEARATALARPARVVLLGCPKPPAVEEALTLGAEAGATAFVLVTAERSPPARPRPDRLARVLLAAIKQCGRADLPGVEGPLPLGEALRFTQGACWLAAPGAAREDARCAGPATLAVGPEGGWSPGEQARLAEAGFRALGLAPYVLRTPTAVALGIGALG